MPVSSSNFKHLPIAVATTLALVGAIVSSVVVGAGIGFLVTVLWFGNTRSDGAAAFLIAAVAGGLFVSVVVFLAIVCRHHTPSPKEVLLPAALWLIAAIQLTWSTCKGAFITPQNALWILKSGDQRSYELGWLITGWTAILVSLVVALAASRMILTIRRSQSPQ
jgi:hypothetical protein